MYEYETRYCQTAHGSDALVDRKLWWNDYPVGDASNLQCCSHNADRPRRLEKGGRGKISITPLGLALLWLKESVGWEFESAHQRGEYVTEKLLCDEYATGYWSSPTGPARFVYHRNMGGKSTAHEEPWELGGIGVIEFGNRAEANP